MRRLLASFVVGSMFTSVAFADVAHPPPPAPAPAAPDDSPPPSTADSKPEAQVGGDKEATKDGAKADAAPSDANTEEAQKALVAYLDQVKKKKWDPAKKLVNPKTLGVIADIKKRTGKEQHPMAPQFWAKDDFYLKDYKINSSQPHALGTIEFKLSCTNYRVQEKGESDGDEASYLVGKTGGKWLVVDRKDNGSFDDSSIKLDYKGYFDP